MAALISTCQIHKPRKRAYSLRIIMQFCVKVNNHAIGLDDQSCPAQHNGHAQELLKDEAGNET